jgi:4-hydroxyphenylpyruvate dioxygenase
MCVTDERGTKTLLQIRCKSSKNGDKREDEWGARPPANSLQMQASASIGMRCKRSGAGCKSAAKAASKRDRARSGTGAAWRRRDLGKPGIRDHIGRARFRSAAMSDNPAPHDLWDNPMGTDGFEFVEYTGPDPQQLAALFQQMGFVAAARHRSKNVTLYKQGDVNFILNAEPESFAQAFARLHGPSVCAIAFRVKDAAAAYQRAISLGAKPVHGKLGPMELNIPAIEGIGGSLIYLVDRYGEHTIYDVDFTPLVAERTLPAAGLAAIDHLTHNVHRGRMSLWAEFYERLFNFREVRYFDIEGKLTGLKSKAMTSPDGKIRIPINESADDKSQIAEYLEAYHGEGIQHIALAATDIYGTVEALRGHDVSFMSVPETYYEAVDARLPGHGEDLARLKRDQILIDGAPAQGQGLLLQIFTETVIGPIFFEIIQRKGNDGFGEGNFRALFESIERDQIRRGVLTPAS